MLISDYVSTNDAIGWPEGTLNTNVAGYGDFVALGPGAPGAGVDWTYTMPLNARYLLHSICATLTTAVAVANRIPQFTMTNAGGKVCWSVAPLAAQVASKTVVYNLGEAETLATDANGNAIIPLPGVNWVSGGTVIAPVTAGLQAADQWSAAVFQYEEYPETA